MSPMRTIATSATAEAMRVRVRRVTPEG
jgi:hypothetical protein